MGEAKQNAVRDQDALEIVRNYDAPCERVWQAWTDPQALSSWFGPGPGSVVITMDVPLAARAVKAGAETIAPNGRAFTEDAIGMTLATRNLMSDLRSAGAITTGPKPFAAADRSRFLSGLDAALMRLTRAGYGQAS